MRKVSTQKRPIESRRVPSHGDSSKADPIAADDKPVGNLGVTHGILLETRGVLHVEPPDEDGNGGDDTQAKRETPHSAQVVLAEAAC